MRPAAYRLAEVALGAGLQASGDPLDQPGPVVGIGRLAEDLGVAVAQLRYGEALQGRDLACDVVG